MKTSETIAELSIAFVAAQAELKNAAFDKINPHFKSKYATLAGIRDGIVPVLSKHGLGVIQGTDMDCVVTRLIHKSGQWIESRYPLAMDKPQQMGSAMTYARRYSLAAICGIASEEDDDANTANTGEGAMSRGGPVVGLVPSIHDDTKTNTRSEFQQLCNEVNNINSLAALRDWKTNQININRMEALNGDLADNFRITFQDKVKELKEKVAA